MPSETAPLKVVARCRALTEDEKNKGAKNVISVSSSSVTVQAGGKEQSFSFDQVFGPDAKTSEVFSECCESLVQRAIGGYNVTVLAYGSTLSGKSHLLAGSDDTMGIIPQFAQSLFQQLKQSPKETFVTASFVEIYADEMTDMLNPHTNQMKIREHDKLGVYVDGLSELVVHNEDDLTRFYTQGNRARKMGATDMKAHKARSSGIFSITIEQKDNAASKLSVRSKIMMVDLAGTELTSKDTEAKSANAVSVVLTALKKGGSVPYRDSKLTRLLQDSLGGNSVSLLLVCVSPLDKLHQETLLALQHGSAARGIKNKVKSNIDETENMITELREEIARLRVKVTKNPQNKEDILKMEELIKDLQLAKKQTWEEKERLSSRYEEERKTNLANKGILDWVMESNKKDSQDQQEKIVELQREKDHLTLEYREKRKKVDELKEDLQKKITEYSKVAQSGKAKEAETKKRVTAIHELKDLMKVETESLKDIKQRLKDAQDRQREEKEIATGQAMEKGGAELRQMVEAEERRRLEKENRAMLAEELERVKMEAEQEKAEIQMRVSKSSSYGADEIIRLESEAADARADKAAVTLHIQMLQQEKELAHKHLDESNKRQKQELEIQQLQHFQTFRQYREVFEQQKVVLEQRYRALLEDAIQDAVFLSSRNTMLQTENDNLRQQMAEQKDKASLGGGGKADQKWGKKGGKGKA